MVNSEVLLDELNRFTGKYQFSFHFLGVEDNSIFIIKDGIELFDCIGLETPKEALKAALRYIYKINRTPYKDRVVKDLKNDRE